MPRSWIFRLVHMLSTLLLVLSPAAAAQSSGFVEALLELNDAVEGIYGDEGALIAPALDRMSRVLADTSTPRPTGDIVRDALGALPFIPLAAYRDGYMRLARGEFDGAIAALRAAAVADPLVGDRGGQGDAVQRAVGALKQGRLLDAQRLLEQSGALSDSSEARRILGLIYWAASDVDRGVEQFEAAIRMNPSDERSRLALARALSSAGREADSARVLEEAIRVVPSGRAHWWLAMSYERVNRFTDARAEFERAAAAAIAGQSHLYGTIGRLASAAADLEGTVDALARAVAMEPTNPAWHKLLAGALLHQDRVDEALAEFIKALQLAPGDAETNLGIGQIHLNAGRHTEAVSALRRATDANGNAIDALYALATALARSGNSAEAARYFDRVEQTQKQILASRRRALSLDALKEEAALATGARDHDRAAALWRQVIQLEPKRASNHAALAGALASAGEDEGAIEEYERAAMLGAEPVVYRLLADLHAKAGRGPDAVRARVRHEAALQGANPAR